MWTKEQNLAIHAEASLLVSAAAGAGKTAVLAERIARLVREGTDVRALLVVTFTEAAAQEMKQRVERKLNEAAQKESDPAARIRLHAQARAAAHGGGGTISTLHAFCLYVLHRNFHILGLDPAFRTADDAQQAMLFQEALEDTAALLCEQEDAGYLALLRAVRGEKTLFAHARELHRFLMAQPEPWAWLARAEEDYTLDAAGLLAHPAMGERQLAMQRELHEAIVLLDRARHFTPNDYPRTLEILDDDRMKLRALLLMQSFPAACAAADATKLRTFSGWPTSSEAMLREEVKGLRDAARDKLKQYQKLPGGDENAKTLAALLPHVRALGAFVRAVDAAYTEKKRARSLIDFSDMEHLAYTALQNEGVAAGLRARYAAIFVDEYQDSSRMQEALLNRIRREPGNLFLVGDVKQSIYRFRQAEPGLFLEKMTAYSDAPEGPRENGAVIYLNRNFRSAPRILSAVNAVFSRVMTLRAGELSYDKNAALYPPEQAADTPLTGCELLLVDQEETGDDALDELHDAEAEALAAGAQIRALMENGRFVQADGTERRLRYADFAVLLRSHRGVAELWAATLAAQGVPAYAQLTGGYFDAIEVQVFLNLLRVIDNRRQDIPLLSVLRAIGRFSDEDIVELGVAGERDQDIFTRLALCAAGAGPLARRAQAFLAKLERYRRESRLLPLPALITYLLEDTGYYACVGALRGGAQRQANLDALEERARAVADAADLAGFLRFMDQARDTADLGRAQVGGADVVRILSMHRSKGLEYPVVILGGLGRAFHRRDKMANLNCDSALGLGLRCAGNTTGTLLDSPLREAIALRSLRQELAEEMRILYVGMTRARQRLLLVGSAKQSEAMLAAAKDVDMAEASWPERARCFLDWLLPVAVQEPGLFKASEIFRSSLLRIAPPQPEESVPQQDDAAQLIALREKLGWRYPHEAATEIPSKISVSALLAQSTPDPQGDTPPAPAPQGDTPPAPAPASQGDATLAPGSLVPPAEREQGALSPAERGSAMHLLFALLPLAECPAQGAKAWVEAWMDTLVARGRMARAQAAGISAGQAATFLESALWQRLCSASRIERELEFSYPMPAQALLGADTEDSIILQGVLDCCFLEDGAWVLLDYKTDYVPKGGAQEVAAQHADQLALYAGALAALTGIPVRERYIVLLRAGESVPL